MEIDEHKIEQINYIHYIQNSIKEDEYFLSGDYSSFLIGFKKNCYLDRPSLLLKTKDWMYDELFIFKSSIKNFISVDELFYYVNYITNQNPENWIEKIKNYNLISTLYHKEKFKEVVDWAINEPLFINKNITINLNFDRIKDGAKYLDSYNPLLLGCTIEDEYIFIIYNSYI